MQQSISILKQYLENKGIDISWSNQLINCRLNIIDQLKGKSYANMFFNNPQYLLVVNLIGLRRLLLEYIQEYNDRSEFKFQNNFTGDIIRYLINEPSSNYGMDFLRRYSLISLDYDFSFKNYEIYLNMNLEQSLIIRKFGSVTIYYKEIYSGELDYFLSNFFLDFSRDLIISEPLYLGAHNSISVKRFVIEEYSKMSNTIFSDEIINDAYNDLIRVSNLGLSRLISEQYAALEAHRSKFTGNLGRSISRGYYLPCPIEYEEDEYNKLFKELVNILNNTITKINKKEELPYNIKDYYNTEQRNSNKIKQEIGWIRSEVIRKCIHNKEISSVINEIHDDICTSIVIFMLHLKLLGMEHLYSYGSDIYKYIRLITSVELRKKPILIKYIIKNGLDNILHDLKEEGLISFHQLENFFGYRVTDLILQEVKEDYMAWFNEGLEKFGKIQGNFINKWGPLFLKSFNYKGKMIKDIMYSNISKYKNEEEILGNVLSYMGSKGAVDDEKIFTEGGKKRGISKNNYFNLVESQKEYKLRGNRRNKVIIKREEYIKQRIVINSSLDTFVPLSKINKVLSVITGGTGIVYFSNSKVQKAEHYHRLVSYLNYNKYVKHRYLCMPLDYSSYDHTITIDMIESILKLIANEFNLPKLVKWFNEFKELLYNEPIYFKELGNDPDNNQYYRYGVLSGWKITSSIESLGNAIITYGVFKELGLDLVDYETMGDDLIIILDKANLNRENQLKLLGDVCNYYQGLGFKMNVPKNSVGYFFLEFLRVTFRPNIIQGYPSRIIGALFYLKPGKTRLNFGADELLGVINKVIKRYGVISCKLNLSSYITKSFQKEDVRINFMGYAKEPWNYEVVRKRKVDFIYKVDIYKTPIYRRYIDLFGPRFGNIVKDVIKQNVIEQSKIVTKLVRNKSNKKILIDKWQVELIIQAISRYARKEVKNDNLIFLPEYLHTEVLDRILRKKNFLNFEQVNEYLAMVFLRMYNLNLIRYIDMQRNLRVINSCNDLREVKTLIKDFKIGVDEYNIPAIVFSRMKLNLRMGLMEMKRNYVGKELDFIRSILAGTKDRVIRRILGKILSMKSEIMGMYTGLPIALMCD